MLKIRLRRVGKKKNPSYRIVVAESSSPRDGAFIDWIGNYDPMVDPPAITVDQDKVAHWISNGAQPTDSVKQLLNSLEASAGQTNPGNTETSE
ncbi:MAG: 30S ribosomal protein S16 [Dehalococcoidia bacterium]|tara:strand:+ start:93 stop:371 length:279 start_codon:yes stop_codon:yes gene_type:complete